MNNLSESTGDGLWILVDPLESTGTGVWALIISICLTNIPFATLLMGYNTYCIFSEKTKLSKIKHGSMGLLLFLFTMFCSVVCFGVFGDENALKTVTCLSIITNWSITILIIIFLIDMIKIAFDFNNTNTKTNLDSFSKDLVVSLIFAFVVIAGGIGLVIFLFLSTGIFGPDNASQYTGHFYVNTLVGHSDTISTTIRYA